MSSGLAFGDEMRRQCGEVAELEIDPAQSESYIGGVKEQIEAAIREQPGILALLLWPKEPSFAGRGFRGDRDAEAYKSHLESAHFEKYRAATDNMVSHSSSFQRYWPAPGLGESIMKTSASDEVTYDADLHMLRFSATDGGAAIPCAVSKTALVALEDDALAGPYAMMITFRRNRERIQVAAIRKYRTHLVEEDGVVVVWRDDVAGEAPLAFEPRRGSTNDFSQVAHLRK